jgi:hypothetical protein
VLATAWLLLPTVAIGLRLRGFANLRAALLATADARKSRMDLGEAESVAGLVDAAARWSFVPVTCLVKSLVLCGLLQQRGLAPELRIGVTKPESDFSAHAWVELGGVALVETGRVRERYSAFDKPVFPGGI